MGMANNPNRKAELARVLAIALSKVGKTHWAFEAAEAGFNIVCLDADVASQTLHRIDDKTGKPAFSDEAKSRVMMLDCRKNPMDLLRALVSGPVYWDDTCNEVRNTTRSIPEDSEVVFLDPLKWDSNTVFMIDSWTAVSMAQKLRVVGKALDSLEDLGQAEYGTIGNALTRIIMALRDYLSCHLIVIAHSGEYIKQRKPDNMKDQDIKQKHMIVEKTYTIPQSGSAKHGYNLPQYFTDVLWMDVDVMGNRYIDGRPDGNKVGSGGTRFTDRRPTSEYSFARLVQLLGGEPPKGDGIFAGVTEYPKGHFKSDKPATEAVILDSAGTEKKKISFLR